VAIRSDDEFRKMTFNLEVEDNWPPVSVETLWVKVAKNGKFTVDSIPFLAKGVAVGDLVEGDEETEGELKFRRKVESSGHSTIQVIVIADAIASTIKDEIKRIGCFTEASPWSALFGIDAPDQETLAGVGRILDMRAAAGEIEYENACIASE